MHKALKLFLSVYVDDFKMAGKKSSLAIAWKQLRTKLDLDEPTKMDGSIYLGCRQDPIPIDDCIRQSMALWKPIYNNCKPRVNQTSQDDEDKVKDMVNACAITIKPPILGQSSSKGEKPSGFPLGNQNPELDLKIAGIEQAAEAGIHPENRHSRKPSNSGFPLGNQSSALAEPALKSRKYKRPESERVKAWEYNMIGHCEGAIDKYLELSRLRESDLRECATPCIDDHMLAAEDFETPGKLSHIGARIVLTVLYLARHNRPESFWSTNHLSRDLNKWTVASDKRLLRLMSFLHYTRDCVQFCYVGDHIKDCFLVQFCDAGFAGDLGDSRSTGGSITY